MGKADLLREFCTILRVQLRLISAKKTYGRTFTEGLVKWIRAKFITAEVVSNIFELETSSVGKSSTLASGCAPSALSHSWLRQGLLQTQLSLWLSASI